VKIRAICDQFTIHPLVSEDLLTVTHRPKVDEYDNYLFIIMKSVDYVDSNLVFNHHAFTLFEDFLLSFSDLPDSFNPITERISKTSGRIRNHNIQYLFFSLADFLLDSYFTVLEQLGDDIEDLELEVLSNPDSNSVAKIHRIKGELIALRRAIWPMRESINVLIRSDIVDEQSRIYFKDLYDHTIEILDTVEKATEIPYRDSWTSTSLP
jgi:magnesium transporter